MRNDWRKPGEALCPERFDERKLADIRAQLGSYAFASLYQQAPTPAEGAIFKRDWLKTIIDEPPPGLKWARGYDLAISTRTTADHTASFRVAIDRSGVMYIADGYRARIEYPEQRRYVIERITAERGTRHGIENAGHARALHQEICRDVRVAASVFKLVTVTEDKVTRALRWSPRAEEGKLCMVRGPWIDEFVEELIRFPKGRHDDQVDAVSVALALLEDHKDRRGYAF